MKKNSLLFKYFSGLGKVGGKKRMASLTMKQASDLGKKAAAARWGKKK